MDVNGLDSSGPTPLHQASIYGHFGIVQRLIKSDANIVVGDNHGTVRMGILRMTRDQCRCTKLREVGMSRS